MTARSDELAQLGRRSVALDLSIGGLLGLHQVLCGYTERAPDPIQADQLCRLLAHNVTDMLGILDEHIPEAYKPKDLPNANDGASVFR